MTVVPQTRPTSKPYFKLGPVERCTSNWGHVNTIPQTGDNCYTSDWGQFKTVPQTEANSPLYLNLWPVDCCTSKLAKFTVVPQTEAGSKLYLRLGQVDCCTSNWGQLNTVFQNVVSLMQPWVSSILYLKLWPVHAHSRSMRVPPPPQVLRVTGCINGLAQVSEQGLKPEWIISTVLLFFFKQTNQLKQRTGNIYTLALSLIPRSLLLGHMHTWCLRRHVNLVEWSQHTLTKHPGSEWRFLHTNYTGLTSWEQPDNYRGNMRENNAIVLKSNGRICGRFCL